MSQFEADVALALFWTLARTVGLRASREEELGGLDEPEHGVLAYPEQQVSGAGELDVAPGGADD